MKTRAFTSLLIRAALLLCAVELAAQTVPATINYQGRLTDNTPSQTPVNATVQLQFILYDAASGGTALWTEPAVGGTPVSVIGGVFSVQLGANGVPIPATVFSGGSDRWLQIVANGELLAPRQKLTATGFANQAQNAASAVSATTAATATNALNLGGQPAANYLTTSGIAYDSSRLGGTLASGWQKSLSVASCPANQFYNAIAQGGTATCAAPPAYTETDPKVGTLTTGRVPRWNAVSLADGALYDTGTRVGIGTASPATQLHVANAAPANAGSVAAGDGPYTVYVRGNYAYLTNSISNSLQIFDVSNPFAPGAPVGSVSTGTQPLSVFVQGRYAYITTASGFEVYDVSVPAAPVLAGSLPGTQMSFVYVQGRYAYVISSFPNTLKVLDVANLAAIAQVGATVATQTRPVAIQVQGRYAYIVNLYAGVEALQAFDVLNPAAVVAAGPAVPTGFRINSLSVQGRYAYVCGSSLQAFDISNPAAIAALGSPVSTGAFSGQISVQGRYAYVTKNTSILQVYDVSDPAAITAAGSPVPTAGDMTSLFVSGRFAFMANYSDDTLDIFDLGGAYLQQLEAGGLATGTLVAGGNAQVGGDLNVTGGLAAGSAGISSDGTVTSRTGFAGPGAGLTGVTATTMAAGIHGNAYTFSNAANAFTGSGAGLTALNAGNIASGTLALARGGTGADLSATGGAGQVLKQTAAGAGVTVAALAAGDIPNLDAAKITTGNLAVARMPAGGAWALTSNLNLDSNSLVVDQANGRVGVGIAAPGNLLHVEGPGTQSGGFPTANEVTAHFKSTIAGQHSAIAVDALTGQDAVVYLGENGVPSWGLRNDSQPSGAFNLRYHGGGANTTMLSVSTAGAVAIPSPGTLSIGVHSVACTPTTAIFDCSCPAGETVVSGGAYGNTANSVRESRPTNTTTWRVTCMNNAGADVICGGMTILCARLAP